MPDSLISKYRRRGVLVDAGLLVGFLVGLLDPKHLLHCRATKSFTREDFVLLQRFLHHFDRITTTPHVLTEVSNLAGRLPQHLHGKFRLIFRALIARLHELSESSATISNRPEFLKFGLADTAIAGVKRGSILVLTDELALFGLLQHKRVDVINFNHLRMLSWT